jgi:YfiH family protein
MIAWSERLDGPAGAHHLATTDRLGGVSGGAYAGRDHTGGLNLGDHVGDRAQDVAANRAALARSVGLEPERLLVLRQVHGREVVHVQEPWTGPAPEADAMVTTASGLGLVVLVADCVPVLLVAPDEGVVAVAHAGRPGLVAGVVPAVVAAVRDLGGRRLVARLGPSVCPRCYPVPLAMREDVAALAPSSRSVSRDAEPAVDVGAGVLEQLAAEGVRVRQLPGCTAESPDLYSYRRDGRTGRFAGLAWRAG